MDSSSRSVAYSKDITYVTNSELGFDYLRDNLAQVSLLSSPHVSLQLVYLQTKEELVLRDFNFCIIDEVDSILIDEARTPLIISGPADKPSDKYIKVRPHSKVCLIVSQAARLASALSGGEHYTIDEKQKNILLTEEGYEASEEVLQVSDLYDPREQWASYVINAIKVHNLTLEKKGHLFLQAKELQIRDVNYIVRKGEVIIVDEFTGRTMPGRRWSDGLHQAVEAKEGITIQEETVTVASISYQNFFRIFPKLAGMTGTAATEANEFKNIYNLVVMVVPTNKTCQRQDNPDVVFRIEDGKWKAAVTEIKRMKKLGRPVLVGTTSVEKSEMLSSMLNEIEIKHQVLNAKPENVERESEIVAQCGRIGSVTIATNMAGRGTDILLGGNPDFMARLKLREYLMPKIVSLVNEDGSDSTSIRKVTMESWKASEELFPAELSSETMELMRKAVDSAVETWGASSLNPLEAEDRLSIACEKAPTDDVVIQTLRAAFQVPLYV